MKNLYNILDKEINDTVVRIFYSVGNGLFAIEKTHGIISVYDCGSSSIHLINSAIERSRSECSECIDNVFISHYDRDHVNGLYMLLRTYRVKRVILPMIPNLAKVIASRYVTDRFLADFILDPISYIANISQETNVIFIESAQEGNIVEPEVINLDNTWNGQTLIGSHFIFRSNDWLYVIYNRKVFSNHQLAQFMNNLNLNIDATTDEILSRLRQKGPSLKSALNHVLTKQEINDLNDYSMVVWSSHASDHSNGCLYTGDYNAKKYFPELSSVYNKYLDSPEIIQIPHHGSHYNFNINICRDGCIHVVSAHGSPYSSRNRVNPTAVINMLSRSSFIVNDTKNKDVVIPCNYRELLELYNFIRCHL